MTKLKVGGLGAAASNAIDPHIRRLYDRPGATLMAVVEFEHVERTQPGPRSDKDASVTVKATHLEVPASPDQEAVLRDVQRTLYLLRTAAGTLDEHSGRVEIDEQGLSLAAGRIAQQDAAEMRIAMHHFADQASRAITAVDASEAKLRDSLRKIRDGINAVLAVGPANQLDMGGEQ